MKVPTNTLLPVDELVRLLSLTGEDSNNLINYANEVKLNSIGNTVYFRGLIEFSNRCSKNCFYCGIRAGNSDLERYDLTDDDILDAARFAYDNRYGSIALQGGERSDPSFVKRIDILVKRIKQLSNNQLGITLSLGEQTKETYQRWFESGAHRYLLRIETSNRELYSKIHPQDRFHNFDNRLEALHRIKEVGYQTGTGVMIGLPYQTLTDLANDLVFMKTFDIHMVGMGPFIEHHSTPFHYVEGLMPLKERFELTLRMLALLRIMMPEINMVASTAMQAIDPMGREKALLAGANILMPNITPGMYRDSYKLYENKPSTNEDAEESLRYIESQVAKVGCKVGYDEWGDSKHFYALKGE